MPVDDLFHSLAEDRGSNAIGVSLSGSGSDGALGMQAIKGEGGVTFAQDEASAKFSSMPKAAIELGCVDFILPPAKIAEELVRISKHPFMASLPVLLDVERVASDEASLKRVFHLLNHACHVDFTHYKRGTMTRRMARRMALLNLNSFPTYISFLEDNPDELQSLYQDLLIRVTSFFRDPEAFEGLTKVVFPDLLEKRRPTLPYEYGCPAVPAAKRSIRPRSACLNISVNAPPRQKFKSLAPTFVNPHSQRHAPEGISKTLPAKYRRSGCSVFSAKADGHYQIAKSIRDLCVFARHNVTRDPPFSQLDLISCHNLLIYFDPALQKRVIPLFHYALKPGGFLMLGPSETIGTSSDLFTLSHNGKFKIYTKNPIRSRSHLDYPVNAGTRKPAPKSVQKAVPELPDDEKQTRDADRIALARYMPAGVLCDENLKILEFRGDTGPYLVQLSGAPSTNLRQLARPGLLVEISGMIEEARKKSIPVRRKASYVEMPDGMRKVNLEVIPVPQKGSAGSAYLVFFEKPDSRDAPPMKGIFPGIAAALRLGRDGERKTQQHDKEALHLKQELDATREHIRTMFEEHEAAQEELKASQEELLSSNEEFQSTNEELETAKEELQSSNEELQSSNEELITTNDELRHRNDELHTLNRQLAHARNYADAIVETLHEPVLVLDKNLRVIRANAAFYSLFELTPAETESCLFYELDNRQWDIPPLRQELQEIILRDSSFQGYEITNVFSGIGEKTLLLNGRHLAWEERALILLAIEDITERKAAHDALKEVERRKDEFLAMLAHELRNPLAPIRNALEIWRRGDAGPEAEKEAQMILDRQLRKESRLVDDLLDVARITRGSIALKKDPVDLVQIVHQAVDSTQHQFDAHSHKLKLVLPKKEIIVEGDAVRLEQIVSNLLINAAKYTEAGGHIVLKLEQQEGKALLSVADNGVGIASHLLPQIFDLFVQANVSIDRTEGGLGIGLTLVRRLTELMGGTVEAKSAGLKKGSEFIVRLPILSGTVIRPAANKNPAPIGVPLVPRRILVVDDNVDSAKTSSLLLELQGHEVQTVFDGPTAIKVAQKFRPEIILLDIGLPGMNGYKVAQQLRDTPATKSALLIALSGYGQAEDRRRSNEAGFDYHLVKPADIEHLNALISRYEGGEKKDAHNHKLPGI